MEIDHIIPQYEDGAGNIENAIAVCFECHAEIHSYNDKHPRGRKFQPEELRKHKQQWLDLCKNHSELLTRGDPPQTDVGPLQAMIDELEFNIAVARQQGEEHQGCLFQDEQFRRAIREGAIATVRDDLKQLLIEAYLAVGRGNQHIIGVVNQRPRDNAWAEAVNRASRSIVEVGPRVQAAHNALLKFLGSEK